MARNALVEIEQGSLIHCNRMVSLGRRDPGCIRIPHGTNVRGGVWRPIPSRSHLLSHLATSACRSLRFLPWIVAASQTDSAAIPICRNRHIVVHAPIPDVRTLDTMCCALE